MSNRNEENEQIMSVLIQTAYIFFGAGCGYWSVMCDPFCCSERQRIGVVWNHFGTADGVAYKEAIEKEIAALNAQGAQIEVSVEGGLNGNDKEGQLAILRSMIAKKYDVILFDIIRDLKAQGTTIIEKLFSFEWGAGYPPEAAPFEIKNRGILINVKAKMQNDMESILKNIDSEDVKKIFAGNYTKKHFFENCKDDNIKSVVKAIIEPIN